MVITNHHQPNNGCDICKGHDCDDQFNCLKNIVDVDDPCDFVCVMDNVF